MADERGVGNVFNVPRGPGPAAPRSTSAICGPRSSRRRPTGRRTWCWSPPASTPCAAIRSGGFTLEPEHYADLTRRLRERLPRRADRRPARGRLHAGPASPTAPLAHVGALQLSVPRHSVPRTLVSSAAPHGSRDARAPDRSIRSSSPAAGRAITARSGSGSRTGTATRAGVRRRRPSSTARPPRRCWPRSTSTAPHLPDDPFDLEEAERRWEELPPPQSRRARGALLGAARSRGQAARRAALPALGTGPGEGAALHLHHRARHSRRRCGRRCGRPSSTRSSRSSWGPTGTSRSSGPSATPPTRRSGWTPTAAGP